MILQLSFKIKEKNNELIINHVKYNNKEFTIMDVLNNSFFNFWNNIYTIIELENKIIIKRKKTNNKYSFKKSENINNIKKRKMEKRND